MLRHGMTRSPSRIALGATVGAAVACLAAAFFRPERADGAAAPQVSGLYSLQSTTGQPAVAVTGKRLTRYTDITLLDGNGEVLRTVADGTIGIRLRTSTLLVLEFPNQAGGTYFLDLLAENVGASSQVRFQFPNPPSTRLAYADPNLPEFNHLHLYGTSDDAAIDHIDGGEPSARILFNGFTGEAQAQIVFSTKETAGLLSPRMSIEPDGDVNVLGTLTKGGGTFRIDHPLDPENRTLSHSFVESPEMMNVYSGTTTTGADGRAVVELPPYFEALNGDPRYQLTVVGDFATAVVSEKVRGNRFSIRTDRPRVEVCWQVTGVRKDPFAVRHPVIVEQMKPATERGRYLHPEAWGVPAERGIGAATRPGAASVAPGPPAPSAR